jgi:chlorobactene glucosyltransferase
MTTKTKPFVSILIPARNEEQNIKEFLPKVLNQTYQNYEVIVLNDHSEDNTLKELNKLKNSRLKIINGKPLPKDWTGKNWACHQLSLEAKGGLYLFLDADVELKPEALESAIALYQEERVSMLSCFPQQRMKSLGEWLIVPIIDLLSLTLLPLELIKHTKTKLISIAIGQFILIDKKAYQNIGGHKSVKNKKTEDTGIARLMKQHGFKISVVRSIDLVKCRMYSDLWTSIQGLSRSVYDGTNMKIPIYILGIIMYICIFILPMFLIFTNLNFIIIFIPLYVTRISTAILAGQDLVKTSILFPIHLMIFPLIAINSIYISLTHQVVWKGRVI